MRNKVNCSITIILLAGAVLACSALRRRTQNLPWKLTVEIAADTPNLESVLTHTTRIIESRLDKSGIPNFRVEREAASKNRLVINLPAVANPEKVKRLLTTSGRLELFHLVSLPSPAPPHIYATEIEAANAAKEFAAVETKVLPYDDGHDSNSTANQFVVVRLPPIVGGTEIRGAEASPDGQKYSINFTLNSSGAAKLATWTGANINEYLAVGYNDEVKSVAFIKSQIYDSGQITGRFTKESAEELASILNTGPLPAPTKLVAESIINK